MTLDVLDGLQTSNAYNKIGTHLCFTSCITISLGVNLPTSARMQFCCSVMTAYSIVKGRCGRTVLQLTYLVLQRVVIILQSVVEKILQRVVEDVGLLVYICNAL